jgi:MFS family permease
VQPSWASRLAVETGFAAIAKSCRNTKILCIQRFVRLFAYGASFLILVHYLSSLGFSDERIGLFMTLTLLGDVVISVILTAVTDKLGRRRVLAAGAALMVMSGAVFYLSGNYWVLVAFSVVGVISPSGAEIGPFRAVEESVLAQLTPREVRSDIFAWYTLFGTAGTALGSVTCGWMIQALQDLDGWNKEKAYPVVFLIYAGFGLLKLLLTLCLTSGVEAHPQQAEYAPIPTQAGDEEEDDEDDDDEPEEQRKTGLIQRFCALFPHISPASRPILYRLIALFSIDAFASGLASPSWITYFFTTVHSLEPGALGTLFLVAHALSSLSNIVALPLARRIGPLKTMVFAHLPSTIFLAMIPIPGATRPGTLLAMGFLALRACTSTMDQAPRQAFISGVVLAGERTAILGVLNTTKTLAQAGGTGSAGVLAGKGLWVVVLSGAGAMKAVYDLLILWSFVGVKERDEAPPKPPSRDEEERS